MLTFLGRKQSYCDQSRREFLSVGALALGGLTLADLLRCRAQAESVERTVRPATKSVIMIYLGGGPSHLDMYDMKPNAAPEFRGEFNPIKTNVPGVDICELMPLQARIMDKLAIVRGIKSLDEHSAHMCMTGFSQSIKRPAIGSVVSYLKGKNDTLPPYVSLMNDMQSEDPAYLGVSHRPFISHGPGLDNLGLVSGVQLDRLHRKSLLRSLDNLRREIEVSGELAGVDSYTARALDMVSTTRAREAFDTSKEPREVRDRFGGQENVAFLAARRLVEAGVPVVTISIGGGWDTHGDNFKELRRKLPRLDQGIHALVTDLDERGLSKDVVTVTWGEFGRTPRINSNGGRDHWAPAGFALMSGGNLKLGQAVGETDARGERAKGEPFSPSNVLATVYRHVGINPAMTVPDHNGRPMYLLENRDPVKGLV